MCLVVTSDDERRYAFFETSDALRGNTEFWDETYTIFANPKFPNALLYYLMNRDISNYKERKIPDTEFSISIKQAFIPPHARYFRHWIETNEGAVEFNARAYSLLDRINEFNEKIKMNHRQLHDAVKDEYDGVIQKSKPNNKVTYRFEMEIMTEHLKAKGWWIDV
jgi:hypothetical protein